jgi:hypothetical protein
MGSLSKEEAFQSGNIIFKPPWSICDVWHRETSELLVARADKAGQQADPGRRHNRCKRLVTTIGS